MAEQNQLNDEVVGKLFRMQEYQLLDKKSSSFNILAVGENGLGKVTLLETLFCKKANQLQDQKAALRESSAVDGKMQVTILEMEHFISRLVENDSADAVNNEQDPSESATVGNKLTIRLMTTFNYCTDCMERPWDRIVDDVKRRIERYRKLKFESIEFSGQLDERVHCCLYFLPPYGEDGLRNCDIRGIKSLDKLVTVIPVLAKSDCYTERELKARKDRVASDIIKYNLQVYQYRVDRSTVRSASAPELAPMAVIGAHFPLRERILPWGTVRVDEEKYSDMNELQKRLIAQDMLKMRKFLKYLHRETYKVVGPKQLMLRSAQVPPAHSGTLPAAITSMFSLERGQQG